MNMKMMEDLIKEHPLNSNTVDSNKRYSSTVNSKDTDNSITVTDKIEKIIEEAHLKPEGIGKILSEGLGDKKSERYYILLATENPQGKLFEALSITKDADRRRLIRINKAVYFMAILKRWGLKTKFKKASKGGDNYDKR